MNFNNTLIDYGYRYDSFKEASIAIKSDQLVITDNDETFYIIQQEMFFQGPFQFDYKIVYP